MVTRKFRILLLAGFFGFCTLFFLLTSTKNAIVFMVASSDPLYSSNQSTLLDLNNFHYLIDNDICSGRENATIFILFLVHTAPAHFANRKAIRETWGRMELGFGHQNKVRTAFLLGSVLDHTLQKALDRENVRHGDLVQGNFHDSYHNLTYKHLMGLRWASNFCSHVPFLVKMDDDIFADVHRLAAALDTRYPLDLSRNDRTRNKLACYVQHKMKVVRDEQNKWFIGDDSVHLPEHFSDYCSGWAYITSPESASKLVKSASYFPYFWVDDVHVTGIVADHAGLTRDPMNDCCFAIGSSDLAQWARSPGKFAWRFLFGPTWGDVQLMRSAHEKATWCRAVKCTCCFKNEKMGDILVEDKDTGKPLSIAGQAQLLSV